MKLSQKKRRKVINRDSEMFQHASPQSYIQLVGLVDYLGYHKNQI